jgi:hypothetical protein
MIEQKNRSPDHAKRLTRTAVADVLQQIESLPTFESIKPARRIKKLEGPELSEKLAWPHSFD